MGPPLSVIKPTHGGDYDVFKQEFSQDILAFITFLDVTRVGGVWTEAVSSHDQRDLGDQEFVGLTVAGLRPDMDERGLGPFEFNCKASFVDDIVNTAANRRHSLKGFIVFATVMFSELVNFVRLHLLKLIMLYKSL